MKKFVSVLVAMVMVLSLGMTSLASGSVTVDTTVTVVTGGVKDKDGEVLEVKVEKVEETTQTEVNEVTKPAVLKEVLADKYDEDLKVVDAVEFKIVVNGEELTSQQAKEADLFPVKATFKVPGSKAQAARTLLPFASTQNVGSTPNVQAIQLEEGTGKWKAISDIKNNGDGTVTLTLNDVGPIVFLSDGYTGGSGTVTGDSNNIVWLVALAVVAGAAVVIVSKKRAR